MWQCMSTPPGITTRPLAFRVRVGLISGSVGASTTLPPATQMSRTWPSIPLAGSYTVPPAILKYSVGMQSRDFLGGRNRRTLSRPHQDFALAERHHVAAVEQQVGVQHVVIDRE